MPKARYVNAFVQSTPIILGANPPTQYGVLLSEYDVREYWDLRTSLVGGEPVSMAVRAFVVSLRQRITIMNASADSFDGVEPVTAYNDYPLLVVQQVTPSTAAEGVSFYLEDYSPKTLNAAVSTSQSAGTSSSDANSVQHMTGSSTSTTNSFDVSGSLGFFGADPTGSVSGGYGHSTTSTDEQATTTGATNEQGASAEAGASMSIKDWSSYAFIDGQKQIPSWVWGQEYPWSAVDYRNATQDIVALPPFVAARLFDGTTLYPPSQISQFGVNFVAHARWVFYVGGPPGDSDETASFAHALTYWEGTHTSVPGGTADVAQAKISQIATAQIIDAGLQLNLPLLALEPIASVGAGNGAMVGFVRSEFIVPPGATGSTFFRLKSSANNLYISNGTGFDALSNEDSVLSAGAITAGSPATMKIQFKVIDESLELTLYVKHWKTTTEACKMTVLVNEADPNNPLTPIYRHVDAADVSSGTDNITAITLRKRDYTSTEYYDYLVMGINTILVTIEPADENATCGYAVRAIAIG